MRFTDQSAGKAGTIPYINDLYLTDEQALVRELVEKAEGKELLEDIGVGPLEDFLNYYATDFIEQIESSVGARRRIPSVPSIGPGTTEFTRMPSFPHSSASVRVIMSTPAFAAPT